MLIIVATFGLSFLAQAKVKSAYKKYSQIPIASGLTGKEVAEKILLSCGISDVKIKVQKGMLSDHYNPMTKTLVLSEDNYHGNSIAAAGISAHECGHAIQHNKSYFPLHIRMTSVGITSVANQVVMWLPLIGMFGGFLAPKTAFTIMAAAWGMIMLFNLVTLPVEFDATRRAKKILNQSFMVAPNEAKGVDKVLNSAALTYVAAFITTLAYFLHYALPLFLGGRSDD